MNDMETPATYSMIIHQLVVVGEGGTELRDVGMIQAREQLDFTQETSGDSSRPARSGKRIFMASMRSEIVLRTL